MKAVKIIEELVFDPGLAEVAGTLQYNTEAYGQEEMAKSWFSCSIKEGRFENMQMYLYVYKVHSEKYAHAFDALGKPDVVLTRLDPEEADEDDQEVWLWRIE